MQAIQHRHRVLVIEDDSGLRAAVADGLKLAGFEVVATGHGLDAALHMRFGFPPCVLLIDPIVGDVETADALGVQLTIAPSCAPYFMVCGFWPPTASRLLWPQQPLPKPFEINAVITLVERVCGWQ